jgi:serine/threonine protein kinase/tetratricopeptide (TPR) repeat protein
VSGFTRVPPAPSTASGGLVERLVREMDSAWRRGERVAAETYLQRHPDLLDQPESAVRLVYEEVCLRQERGETVAADELARRFPRWAGELAVLLDCHRLMGSGSLAPPPYPAVGEWLADFRLVAELGRGGQGRVFLATQAALADRPVVLKVTPRRTQEHLSLARLQHTHVIPLHGMYDFPERNLRALCMPFVGGATLARVLLLLHDQPVPERTGRSLVDAIDVAQKAYPFQLPRQGVYRHALARSSFVEAVCRVGACLADGLHYAHERGLVHFDLKPSNVLLAADAQPLLLDFHLALRPLRAGQLAPEWFGGTPGFMSPEQEAAWDAVNRGQAVPADVDARSDIYSLGRLLFTLLAGDEAPAEQPPSLFRRSPSVSRGLSDVIHKCLEPKPEDRYPDTATLAADLRRHLAHLPLRGVPNRDFRERWRKWHRRRPNAPLWAGLLLALAGAGAVLVAAGVDRYRDGQAALVEGRGQFQRGAYLEAVHTLERGKARAVGFPGGRTFAGVIDAQLRKARRALAAEDLHAAAERLRYLTASADPPAVESNTLDAQCRAAWEARGTLADRDTASLSADAEERIRCDLFDLAILWADLKHRRAARAGKAGEVRADLRTILAEAETILGDSPALARERRRLEGAAQEKVPPGSVRLSPWEQFALARSLLQAGDLTRAADELDRAVAARPQDFWANFYRGACAYRRNEYADAVHSFGVAVALTPASAECYYNRALSYAAGGQNGRALADYDRALELAPHFGAAALNRGVLHYQQGRMAEARADLERALLDGADPAAAHYNLALVRLGEHDRGEALSHLEQTLRHDPAHAASRSLRDLLLRQK